MMSENVSVLLFFVLFASVLGSDGRSSTEVNEPDEMVVYRLPGNTIPVSYNLNIMPDYNYFTNTVDFNGEVEILIDVISKTSTITLNCNDILIYVVYVHEKKTKDNIDVLEVKNDSQNEQCNILLRTQLKVGIRYVVNIEYHVNIRVNNMEGFYKSTYNNKDNHKQWLLLTYFEPTGARSIFPCYDEPSYKTPFNITLTRPKNQSSRANMPIYTSYYDKSVQDMRDIFVETPPISTHMVVFVISGFDPTTTGSVASRSPVYVFSDFDRLDQLQYVSGEAPKLLAAMESFTEVPYELPKLDLFAIPDFKSDSMGNWGLNTFR
ncbi:endoplasmic reticulum aminopeptidase 1-like [Melanaphis sacchari]|uniref:endoplasmic reticulum aminopeptidase 1-like n=1 Tax=Melanaphis sacchari TaxID=742174 RepID=UPI000DC144FC|nr:endoplasmic reticulum aminopeptidase 1-like [Melanaphis sacchari]